MTQEQEKVLALLKKENERSIKNGLPFVKDATLFEPLCEIAPKGAIEAFNKSYSMIMGEDDHSFSIDFTERNAMHGKVELLCWELYLQTSPRLEGSTKAGAVKLLDAILNNMEFYNRPIIYLSQNEITQKALKGMSKNTPYQLEIDGTGLYEVGKVNTSKYFKMVIAQFSDIPAINDNTIKLFVLIHEKYGLTRTSTVIINIDEWLEKQGIKPTKSARDNARKVITNQLELLYSFSLSGRTQKPKGAFSDMRIIDAIDYPADRSGNFYVTLGRKYEAHIKDNAPIFAYNLLYKLKRDTQIKILLKLGFNYRSNEGEARVEKIGVQSMLEFCGYPKLDRVREQDGSPKARIMKPFIKDLKALQEADNNLYFSFITDVDDTEVMLDDAEKLDFDDFYKNYYLFCDDYAHLPQNKKRIAANESYTKKAKADSEKKAEKKKKK